MNNKRIVFTKINRAELIDEHIAQLVSNQVLVEIRYSAISSGTERANITGDPNVSISNAESKVVFPRCGGYSSSGIVLEVGESVKHVKKGDRVALSWSNHGKYCLVDEQNVHKIPFEDISLKAAALCHISTFSLAAVRKCRLEIGESAIVMGLGVLGIIAIELLKAAGAYPVIAVDPIESKRAQALNFGADYAFNPFDKDFARNIKEITDGGVNVAIEVTGNGGALNSVLDCMAKMGRVALLGCTRNSDFTVDYYHKVHGPGISLIGAHTSARPDFESAPTYWSHHDDCVAVMKLLHGQRLDFDSLISEIHSPENAQSVYDRLIYDKEFSIAEFCWNDIEG